MSIPFETVEIPGRKPLDEYSTDERRADLYQRLKEAGHPRVLNQTKLAGQYGVNQSTISRDMSEIMHEIGENIGVGADLTIDTVFRKALHAKADSGEWDDALDIGERWYTWLNGRGAQAVGTDETESSPANIDPKQAYMDMARENADDDRE